MAAFEGLDACVTPVLSSEEAAQHPHNKGRGAFLRGDTDVLQSCPAPKLSRTPGIHQQLPLPKVGEHTIKVLTEFGFSNAEINELIKSGALFQASKL